MKSVQIRSFFCSVFPRIRTEYGEIRSISLYSVRMWENTDQKKLRIWTHFTQSFITKIQLNSLQTSCLTTSKKCAVGNATSIRAFKFSYCKITNQLKVPYRVKNVSPFEGIIRKNDKFRVYRGVIIYQDKQRKINNSDNLKSLRLSIT